MCSGITKFILFAFNLVTALGGLALVVLGALVEAKLPFVTDVLKENKLSVPAITFIVLGSLIFIIAFLGCCGAAKESHCMLISYAVILCAILVVEIVIAVLAFVYRKDLEGVFEKGFTELFDHPDGNEEAIDSIQMSFKCCGLHGPTSLGLRPSCCGKTDGTCLIINAFKTGCFESVKDFIGLAGNVLGGVAIGVAAVELVGVIFSCCMANEIRNMERRRGIA